MVEGKTEEVESLNWTKATRDRNRDMIIYDDFGSRHFGGGVEERVAMGDIYLDKYLGRASGMSCGGISVDPSLWISSWKICQKCEFLEVREYARSINYSIRLAGTCFQS